MKTQITQNPLLKTKPINYPNKPIHPTDQSLLYDVRRQTSDVRRVMFVVWSLIFVLWSQLSDV